MGADQVENAYDALSEAHGGERWAFGTGFDDPLAGVDTRLPDGIDGAALGRRCLALGDDALVLSQRLAGWCSNAPELEDEMALANIALDLLGQARLLLARAGLADPSLRPVSAPEHLPDEDALAYFRDAHSFGCVCLVEVGDGGDFAVAMVRLLIASSWRLWSMRAAMSSADPVLAAVAAKAVPELTYHRDYAAGWVVRLGDGTALSGRRTQAAVDLLWPMLPEIAEAEPSLWPDVAAELDAVVATATLTHGARTDHGRRGRSGEHTTALAPLLREMQAVARAYPAATW